MADNPLFIAPGETTAETYTGPSELEVIAEHVGIGEIVPDAQEGTGQVETLTSTIAQDQMRRNIRNRPVAWVTVMDYARDMRAHRWPVNGETIKIATDDQINDGQHRMLGLIQAANPSTPLRSIDQALAIHIPVDVAIRSWVIRGLPPETQDTVDQGVKRKMAHQLAIHREENPANLAVVARWAWRWLRGMRQEGGSGPKPTLAEQMEFINAEPRLRMAAAFATEARSDFNLIRPGVWGMAWLMFNGANTIAAELFLTQVRFGENLSVGDPAMTLRNRLIKAKTPGPQAERLSAHEELYLMVQAWNTFCEGGKIFRLTLPPGGLKAHNFPEPKGFNR
jgi:hypothetical protein